MLIYVAGRYTYGDKEENLQAARKAVGELINAGLIPICPITMYAHLEDRCPYDTLLDIDLQLLDICDCLLLLPNWKESKGACRERLHAIENNIPVFESVGDLVRWLDAS